MKMPRRRRGDLRQLCAQTAEGDGIDPRDDDRAGLRSIDPMSDPSPSRLSRKMLQLCKQVQRAVETSLHCCGDPLLSGLRIESSRPVAGGAGIELLVLADGRCDVSLVASALARARSLLRAEVARCITRRKVPTLSFRVHPLTAGGTHS